VTKAPANGYRQSIDGSSSRCESWRVLVAVIAPGTGSG